jgi:hypothetical protein
MEGKEFPKSCQIWKSKDGTLGNSLVAIVINNSQRIFFLRKRKKEKT